MRFFQGKQTLKNLKNAQEQCLLLTNGLGGYASVTAAYSTVRCDQGVLVAAVKAPNERITMVHRLRERLLIGEEKYWLSSQAFAGRAAKEDGFRHLSGFSMDCVPQWSYQLRGVYVKRTLCMEWGRTQQQ